LTAKDLGAITSRALAIYVGIQAVQYASLTAQMVQPAMRFATRRNFPPWPNYAIPAAIFLVAAIALWVSSNRFWPRESEQEPAIEFDQLKRLVFMALGTYFLIDAAPSLIADVLSTMRNDVFTRTPGIERWIYDSGASVAGLGLIVANMKRDPLPGFDDIRSTT
jgi:hypothetical protein